MTIHKIKPVIITAFSILMLTAVSSCKHNKQLNEVYYLQSRTDSVHKVFMSLPARQMQAMQDSTDALLERFWACCKDSLENNAQLSLELSDLQKVKKGLGKMKTDMQKIQTRIGYSKKKLEDLAHDVKNGLMDEKTFKQAYKDEKQEQDYILNEIERVKNVVKEIEESYNRVAPPVRKVVKS